MRANALDPAKMPLLVGAAPSRCKTGDSSGFAQTGRPQPHRYVSPLGQGVLSRRLQRDTGSGIKG
jgi:hypothetical protein